MLVLSRKKNESFKIYDPARPDDVATITLVEIRGDKVRFGITAPESIMIARQEIYEAMRSSTKCETASTI